MDHTTDGLEGVFAYMDDSRVGSPDRQTHLHHLAKVGTRYFFLSLLPLFRYLEIVLALHAGPLFKKNCKSASTGPLFRYRYFFRSALAALPLVHYTATAIFSIVLMLSFSFSNKL